MSSSCYIFESIIYNDGLFNNTVDATYIINLEKNGRLDNILNQLKEYHPTNIVYLVFNRGYKKCKKENFIINSAYDLVDAHLTIFKHAKEKNYNNILILEDDFIFSPEIKSKFHINNINNFLNKNKNKLFQYYIGCLPIIMIPYDTYNYINKSTGTHAVIYSKKIREDLLNIKQINITDWDIYNNIHYLNRYSYYKPLCYQIFTDTENSKLWGINEKILKIPIMILTVIVKKIFIILKLNKQPEPGFTFFYNLSKILFYALLLLVLYQII